MREYRIKQFFRFVKLFILGSTALFFLGLFIVTGFSSNDPFEGERSRSGTMFDYSHDAVEKTTYFSREASEKLGEGLDTVTEKLNENLTVDPEQNTDTVNESKDNEWHSGITDFFNSFTSDSNDTVSKTGEPYQREYFGNGWVDTDNNGCGTRDDILARDLTDTVIESNCKVTSGTLNDPFTGETINFIRGASQVDIDHIVPLKYAWDYGADSWTEEQRIMFANDPNNLLAVSASANRSKGANGPTDYMPSNTSFQCEYVSMFIELSNTYELDIPESDKAVSDTVC